jgi:diguanylate cyclase (GGDEF)-like protein/PAS domain S-box-containing protein
VDPVFAIDALPCAALALDRDERIVAANDDALALIAGDAGALVGRALRSVLSAGAGALREGAEVTLRRRDDVPLLVHARARASDGGALVLISEITGAALLDRADRYFDAAFDRSPLGMALYNTAGEFTRVNATLAAMLGRAAEELVGTRDQLVTHPDDRQVDVDAAELILAGELHTFQREKRFLHADGRAVWVIANLCFLRDEAGNPLSWVGQFQDISAQKDAERRLSRLADRDDLTGLANRRALHAELRRRLAAERRNGGRVTALVVDLDGFKAVNDRCGHAAGDAFLVMVAERLRADLRTGDLAARLGGDEFAVLLGDRGPADVATVTARIIAGVEELGRAEHPGLGITASVGASVATADDAVGAEALLREADRAMYVMKRARTGGLAA